MSRLRVRYVTIYVFPPPARGKAPIVRTSPERLVARAGDAIEWTVVNASGLPGRVTLGWQKDNPLKGTTGEPLDRRARDTVRTKAKDGVDKYSVLLDRKVGFDPDIEIMS